MDVITFLDQWGMLILTAIYVVCTAFYVVCTICLCVINSKSNEISRNQFDSNKPPALVAYLYPNVKQGLYRIRIENEGGSCAYNVCVLFDQELHKLLPNCLCNAEQLKYANFSIGKNQYYDIILCSSYLDDDNISFDIEIRFESKNKQSYKTSFNIDLTCFKWLSSINNQECSITNQVDY